MYRRSIMPSRSPVQGCCCSFIDSSSAGDGGAAIVGAAASTKASSGADASDRRRIPPVLMPPPWLFLSLPRELDRRCSAESARAKTRSRREVRHLDPIRIFRAALTSRSRDSPQSLHTQDLTINPLTPRGPLTAPQAEQVTLVFLSLTTSN